MANKLRKINRLSIGKKNADKVAEIFGVTEGTVYRALRGDTSDLSHKIREHVIGNRREYKMQKIVTYKY